MNFHCSSRSASLSKFDFEPKGSEISSSWRRVRANSEPFSTVIETISPKSKHCRCNICAIILSFLSKMCRKEKVEHFFDNLVITYSPKGNTQENRLPCLPPISLNDGRHKRLSFRQRLNKRAFYIAYWQYIKLICQAGESYNTWFIHL